MLGYNLKGQDNQLFERYTEKARRVLFFGRYEASQYGSSHIRTEHLLLGIFREDKALIRTLLPSKSQQEITLLEQSLKQGLPILGPKSAYQR